MEIFFAGGRRPEVSVAGDEARHDVPSSDETSASGPFLSFPRPKSGMDNDVKMVYLGEVFK